MKVTTTPAPGSQVVLEVELPAERIQRSVDRSARHLAQRTRIPGFRPGKVPRAVLERSLGVRRDDPTAPNPLYDDAKEHLFEESMLEALRETPTEDLSQVATAASEFFLEVLATVDMTQRGLLEGR